MKDLEKFGLDQVTEDILNSGIMKAYLQDSGRLTGSLPEKGAPGSTRLQDMARGLGEGIDPLLDLAVSSFFQVIKNFIIILHHLVLIYKVRLMLLKL